MLAFFGNFKGLLLLFLPRTFVSKINREATTKKNPKIGRYVVLDECEITQEQTPARKAK